jgi:hypothetical protein
MARVLKKRLLVFLLAWLPLQASALPLIALLCEQAPAGMHGHAAPASHHGAGEHPGQGHHGAGDDGHPPAQPHSCCHNLTSGAVPSIVLGAAERADGIALTPLPHHYRFVPEQPQPPPLAA